MVTLEDEVALEIVQWTPLQRDLHKLVQKIDALPNYVKAGMEITELMAIIRSGITQHGGSLEAIKRLYAEEGVDFNPDKETWDILAEKL